ncbi:hypothetical protein [Aquimarina sp. 2201CG14-23]|uniref:hypothetical protein n=1 Tax=Aquimarina mycalae TaxID=3040073 RepID=UPI002477D536|nr:hypothetical protein [Aquimarina sp. 2201CG14-23]MDH7447580.1 hypothetical protein [Aquimarina sp. 2201CG14-23]
MKNKLFFFGLWCLFLPLSGCAQNNSVKTQLQLLQTPLDYQFPIDSIGFSEIKNTNFLTKNGAAGEFDINSNNVHLIDVNNDDQKDIICQDNRHYQTTIVLIKKGNDFVEIWNKPGALVDIKQGKQTTIYVLCRAIGCLNETSLSELAVNNDNTITENIIELHTDTKLTKLNTTFEQKTLSGILRTQPIIDDIKKKDPCTGDVKRGNQIRVIENKNVIVIKTQSDWCLVVLKEKEQSSVGWIKV